MMKRSLCVALVGALVCVGSASAATTLTMTLVDDGGGAFHIDGLLSGDASEGLALWSVDVGYDGAACAMSAPAAGGMDSFVKTDGLTNPVGYGGTPSGSTLIQVGGGQNTINNNTGNAPYPVGTVATGVGNTTADVLAEGSAAVADTITIADGFANVILLGETGPVYAVEAADIVLAGTPLTLASAGCASLTAAYSMGTHGASQGDLGLLIGASGFVEGRAQGGNGDLWVELQFDAAVVPGDFDVVMVPDPGVAYQLVAGDVGTELKLTYGSGAVPDDMYNVTITCAGSRDGGAFCLTYLEGDADQSGVVGGLDKAAVAGQWNNSAGVSDAATRADIDRSGVVGGLDKAAIAGHWNNSASKCP